MLRFTTRDLVLLTLAVAIGVGWTVDRWRLAGPLSELAEYQRLEAEKTKSARQQAEQISKLLRSLGEVERQPVVGPANGRESSKKSRGTTEDGSIEIDIVDH